MFRLLRLTLALIATFAAAIFVVCLIGTTQPTTLAQMFSSPDGKPCEPPCLFGIQLGKTSESQAALLLKAHPLVDDLKPSSEYSLGFEITGKSVLSGKRIILEYDLTGDAQITNMNVFVMDGDYQTLFSSVGEAVALWGPPKVSIAGNGGTRIFYWENGVNIMIVRDTPLASYRQAQILRMGIGEPLNSAIPRTPWCGFTIRDCNHQ